MLGLALAAAWVATGVIAVVVMRRRGHDAFSWALLFVFLGPIALPVAISSDRHRPVQPPRPLPPGGLDVLVAHDGTAEAQAALDSALTLLGPHMTSMTMAAVVDLEAESTVRGRDTQRQAQERLDALARHAETRTDAPVGTIILFGEPATALQRYAVENSYEIIVVGSGAAGSHVPSRRFARSHQCVPVLIGPSA